MNINKLFDIVKREEKKLGELRYTELDKGEFNILFVENPKEDSNVNWAYPWHGEGLACASPAYRKVDGGVMVGLEFDTTYQGKVRVDEEFIPVNEAELEEL